jgi:hypothetical protein
VFARKGVAGWLARHRSNALKSRSVAKPKGDEKACSRGSVSVKRTVSLSGGLLARSKTLRVEEGSSFHDGGFRGDLGVLERACAVFRNEAGAGSSRGRDRGVEGNGPKGPDREDNARRVPFVRRRD